MGPLPPASIASPVMPARPRPRVHPGLLLAVVAVALLAVVHGPVAAQSVADARAQRAAIQQRLDAAAEDLARLESRVGELGDRTATLESRMATLQAAADEADARVAARVREMYKRGIDTPVLQLLSGDDANAALERAELAGHLLGGDRAEIETALAARTRVTEVADQLAVQRADLDAALADQQAVLTALRADLDRAAALEARLVQEEREREQARRRAAEAARRRAAEQAAVAERASAPRAAAPSAPSTSTAPTSGGRACPVGQPHSFTDTWGAPRSGGRSHQGVDILANYGTPVYAMVSGVWDIYAYGASAGNWAILRGTDGNTYYYMHLQSHTVGDGARVTAGQQTGTVGDTGNARGTPHLHFEYHPGGGGPVNPYPITRDAC